MQFDFSAMTERRNTHSEKWNVKDSELPMWVADMDFQTAPEIIEAVKAKAAHGIYGYAMVPDDWYEAIGGWWEKRHHFRLQKEWLAFCTGIVPAISSAVRKMTTVGENVLIQTPDYNAFFGCIKNNGRTVLENELDYDGVSYKINFADLEQKLSNPQTTLMILCNPQNPTGQIWDRETLERIGELCWKHHVLVLSDEIHCDLADPGCEYIPFASVSEHCAQNSITCISPTKTFNLAGLQTAAVSVPNEVLRHKMVRGLSTDDVAEPNVFATEAAVAAFTKGGDWLDALCEYIYENKKTVKAFLEANLPELYLLPSQATYLLWVDCKGITSDATRLCGFIREKTGLFVNPGEIYGMNGRTFFRMNIACPRARLEDGLQRLKKGVDTWKQECEK